MWFSYTTLKLWQKMYSNIKRMNDIFYTRNCVFIHSRDTKFSSGKFCIYEGCRMKTLLYRIGIVDLRNKGLWNERNGTPSSEFFFFLDIKQ